MKKQSVAEAGKPGAEPILPGLVQVVEADQMIRLKQMLLVLVQLLAVVPGASRMSLR